MTVILSFVTFQVIVKQPVAFAVIHVSSWRWPSEIYRKFAGFFNNGAR
jgi:hypothetical protein